MRHSRRYDFQGHLKSRSVRRWPQSPFGTIFRSSPQRWPNKPGKNVSPSVRPPSYRVTWLQSFYKNRLRPILMKLGMMLEVDETFKTIWLSRSSEVRVKVRRWPQSPIRTIFTYGSISSHFGTIARLPFFCAQFYAFSTFLPDHPRSYVHMQNYNPEVFCNFFLNGWEF